MLVHIWESSLEERQSEAQIMSDLYLAALSQTHQLCGLWGRVDSPCFLKRIHRPGLLTTEKPLKKHIFQSFM